MKEMALVLAMKIHPASNSQSCVMNVSTLSSSMSGHFLLLFVGKAVRLQASKSSFTYVYVTITSGRCLQIFDVLAIPQDGDALIGGSSTRPYIFL